MGCSTDKDLRHIGHIRRNRASNYKPDGAFCTYRYDLLSGTTKHTLYNGPFCLPCRLKFSGITRQ